MPRLTWSTGPAFIPQASLPTALQDTTNNVYATDYEVNVGNFDAQYPLTGRQLQATYFTPFYMHGAMGAGAATADVRATSATVYSGTQGPYPLRAALVPLLGLPYANIRVVYVESAGCYGHNSADDVAAEAALISKLCGKPVRLQWTRVEEHRWEPLSSAMVHLMRGGVTGSTVVAWEHRVFSASHNARPNGASLSGGAGSEGNLLPAQMAIGSLPADAPALGANTATRNAPVIYTFANNRLQRNFVKSFNLQTGTRKAAAPLNWVLPRTTALRSLGGFSNSFANESFMDELAAAAGTNPVAFRIAHLNPATDQRGIDIINAAWSQASAQPLPVAPAGYSAGRGIAFQRYEVVETYVAVVVDLLVNLSTGALSIKRVVVAHDCGQIVNPDGLTNQIEGNVLQGISRTLKEQVDYTADRISNNAWTDYAAFGQIA